VISGWIGIHNDTNYTIGHRARRQFIDVKSCVVLFGVVASSLTGLAFQKTQCP